MRSEIDRCLLADLPLVIATCAAAAAADDDDDDDNDDFEILNDYDYDY